MSVSPVCRGPVPLGLLIPSSSYSLPSMSSTGLPKPREEGFDGDFPFRAGYSKFSDLLHVDLLFHTDTF